MKRKIRNSIILASCLFGILTSGCETKLKCENSGTHQDVAKNPLISIESGPDLAKGDKIHWVSSDGDEEILTLEKPLVKGGPPAIGIGKPGNAYTCTATVEE